MPAEPAGDPDADVAEEAGTGLAVDGWPLASPVPRVGDPAALAGPGFWALAVHTRDRVELRCVPVRDGDQLFAATYAPYGQDPAGAGGTQYMVRHADGSSDEYWADGSAGRHQIAPTTTRILDGGPGTARWEPAAAVPRPEPGVWHWPGGPDRDGLDVPVEAADRVLVQPGDAAGPVVHVLHPDGSTHRYDGNEPRHLPEAGGPLPVDYAGWAAHPTEWDGTLTRPVPPRTSPTPRREVPTAGDTTPTPAPEPVGHRVGPRSEEPPAPEPPVGEQATEEAPAREAGDLEQQPAEDFDLRARLAGGGVDPDGERARFHANMAAIAVLDTLDAQGGRPATADEQGVLAGWTGWGALPQLFAPDPPDRWVGEAEELRGALDETAWAAARHTTMNAHYTNPEVIAAVWDAVRGLGFDGGHVLEPGCGSGLFLGLAPDGARMHGVELDPTTARVAAALYPSATVRAESFAESPWQDGTFDAVVGNVPFADVRLYDPVHNPGNHVMHNHFILKSLDLTRPGGIVAVLTSRYTMDAQDPSAREAMFERADLLAAVRLPTGTHREIAGTEAVTDVLVFRRRPPGQTPAGGMFLTSTPRPVPPADPDPDVPVEEQSVSVPLNEYWSLHPSAVLGEVSVGHGMHGAATVRVGEGRYGLPMMRLGTELDRVIRRAVEHDMGYLPARPGEPRPDPDRVPDPVARVGDIAQFEGHMTFDAARSEWTRLAGGLPEPFEVPASAARELRALLQLRDAAVALLDAEAATPEDTPQIADARAVLNRRYDGYVASYGPVNRFKASTSSRLDRFGNPVVAHHYPTAAKIFRADPHSALVRALETYHKESGEATKAPIFTRRVVSVRTPATRADTPEDAVAISLDQVGRVDLPTIAALLEVDEPAARDALGTLVFADPAQDGRLAPAAEYLSGNVRAKLAAAKTAAETDPAFGINVDALTGVIPRDLTPDEITVRMGAVWLPERDVQAFLAETLDDPRVRVQHLGGSNWSITAGAKGTTAATSTWGTTRMDALSIAERLMCQRKLVVTDEDAAGHRIVNPVETEAAQAKGQALQEALGTWVWADPDRAARLGRIYNDTFNAIVLRDYSTEGDRLTLPGLVAGITPHPHQRSAVARMIAEPSVGLFHAVGAGKTAEMVMGAMELRRLHLASKPLVVVPNHMLEQFSREWLQWYPQANVLAAGSDDVKPHRRREFIARAATGDWDGIIMTQSAFKAIGVGHATMSRYIEEQTAALRTQLEKANQIGASSRTVKQMEKQVTRGQERLKKKLDHPVDPGLTFEQLGVDYLIVDELHDYKNLMIVSHIDGVSVDGSDRATDLDMKISYLRAKVGPTGRVMAGATGTPIANSMAEAYVTQRYLRPDLLTEAGMTDFDSWAATFGQTITRPEMKPAGDGFKLVTRFARFANIPELLRLWHVFGDVRTTADLNLPTPDLAPGPDGAREPEIVAIPLNTAQTAFMKVLAQRAERVNARAVDRHEDNMLSISNDGRAGGLDVRLLRAGKQPVVDATGDLAKVQVAAARITQICREHRNDEFTVPGTDQVQENKGAFQIVFSDLGAPKEHQWNVYNGLKDELVTRGMDPTRVRFMHEANTDTKKARLFADCRAGRVDVLIGSTQKMGVGTNIQDRAVALHHLDCPWRPADVEQREGRILRQGNQYPQVQILRYVTEGSFDGYMWQTVARKAAFIDQVMHGRLDQREAEDLGGHSQQFGYHVITAVASGNPLLLERAQAQEDATKLQRLQTAHRRDQGHRRTMIASYQRENQNLTELIPVIQSAIDASVPTGGDAFRATTGNTHTTKRPDAAVWVRAALGPAIEKVARGEPGRQESVRGLIGLGGHTLDATVSAGHFNQPPTVTVRLRGLQDHARFTLPAADITAGDARGVITRMEHLVSGLPHTLATTQARIARNDKQIEQARADLGKPFPRADELTAAQDRLSEVIARMRTDNTQQPDVPIHVPDPQDPHGQPIHDGDLATAAEHLADGNYPARVDTADGDVESETTLTIREGHAWLAPSTDTGPEPEAGQETRVGNGQAEQEPRTGGDRLEDARRKLAAYRDRNDTDQDTHPDHHIEPGGPTRR